MIRSSEAGFNGFPLKEGFCNKKVMNQSLIFGRMRGELHSSATFPKESLFQSLYEDGVLFLWVCVPWEQNCLHLSHHARLGKGSRE